MIPSDFPQQQESNNTPGHSGPRKPFRGRAPHSDHSTIAEGFLYRYLYMCTSIYVLIYVDKLLYISNVSFYASPKVLLGAQTASFTSPVGLGCDLAW